MRVLLVGASGAIGSRLIPQLTERGHQVTGTSRSAAKAGQLRSLGAEPAVLDVLDAGAVRALVAKARPDAIVYEATALAGQAFSRNMDRGFAPTNELRTKGTDILLAAAAEAGVARFIAQSFAPFRYAHIGGPVKDEGDPLMADPPPSARLMFAAMAHVDQAVTAAGGIALRYGGFYGDEDAMVTGVRKRQFPLIGDGARRDVVHPPGGRGRRDRARARRRGPGRLQHHRRRARPDARLAARPRRRPRREAAVPRSRLGRAACSWARR